MGKAQRKLNPALFSISNSTLKLLGLHIIFACLTSAIILPLIINLQIKLAGLQETTS
jgi:hypothetical protein